MKAVCEAALKPETATRLQHIQASVDQKGSYEEQVAYAKESWKTKPANPLDDVKKTLVGMCSGNTRCCYCEDSFADEIEHMRPKDLYPEQTYVWTNYVLACGPCNGPKNNRFAVLDLIGGLLDVTRKRKAPVVPPTPGVYALVDPRAEDPLDFLWLDFQTMRYVPNTDQVASELYVRAKYTIDVLRLNERDALVRGRRSAFTGFTSRLQKWVNESAAWSEEQRNAFVADFREERYLGVWERMKRYRTEVSSLKEVAHLMEAAPESGNW